MTAEPARSAARMRASDADREAVVEQLREAAAEGRIDMDELDTRLGQALSAKTYAELAPLTEDLVPIEVATGEPLVLKGGVHGMIRAGVWKVPPVIRAQGGIGGVRIDFTRAECRLREISLEVRGEMGGVKIVVPEGWTVESDSLDRGIGGLKDKTTEERTPGAPTLRLSGSCGMGGVLVRHPNFRERRKLRGIES
ncbi:DUF1707 SHOCT-like domain-containing protein [Streptomyces sp. WC2508]|uniref:DUF1707 SHOCT-like domain-containing protein n=1 Tax=Streptomyces sp. WC2508 TaxID=3461405 RepID=UPI0040448D3E